MENMRNITLDLLLGILTAYEMRSYKGNSTSKESVFKEERSARMSTLAHEINLMKKKLIL